MRHGAETQELLDRSWLCLEKWDVSGARHSAEAARAQASTWGDRAGAALADILLARAGLLVLSEPSGGLLRASTEDVQSPALGAARARLGSEIASARLDDYGAMAWAPLEGPPCVDAVAAIAMAGGALIRDPARARKRLAGIGDVIGASHFDGWGYLVAAVGAEAQGSSGLALILRAEEHARADNRLALLWAALRAKIALCERRGVQGEANVAKQNLNRLLEGWALTLSSAEAQSALCRPDRAAVRETEPAPMSGANPRTQRLLDAALALAQERDADRVTEAALDAAIAITGAERGILLLLDESGEHRVGATRHVGSEGGALVGLSATIARRALREGEVILANDIKRDPRFSDCASVAIEVSNVLCAPIHARGQIEGALYLDRRGTGRPFDEAAAAGARALGAMVAASLLNARVIAELTDKTRELETAREELSVALASRTIERNDISRRLAAIQDVVPAGTTAIVGRSPPMLRMRRTIEMVSASDAAVLIAGETGSGKELVARAIHASSNRRDRPFVAVNCGSLSENLLAAELFGAERGAYTSATSSRPGLFVAAHSGTLFLDEVGDMPPAMQAALLRVLETSEIRPVGSTKSRRVDVRILAASHRDLLHLVRQGTFRDDLRYRLEVIRVEVPPLRDRLDDMQELCEHLLREARRAYGLPERRLSPSAIAALELRRWPGNVRELKHVLASAALAAEGPIIGLEDIPPERAANLETLGSEPPQVEVDGHAMRADSIRRALRATAGNRGQAAKLLGISRSTLYRYLESHGISADSVPPIAEAEESNN